MTVEHHLKSEKLDLIKFKKNIWSFFPNYNKEFDETLKEALICKSQYRDALDDYHIHLKRLNESTKDSNYQNFLDNFGPLFVISQFLSILISTLMSLSRDINYIYLHIFITFISLLSSFFLLTKELKSTIKQQTLALVSSEEKLHEIEKAYKKIIKKFVKNGQELNVREHLEHYYNTNIPELNLIIQDILDNSFEKDFVLTNNVGDNLQQFDIEKADYIKNITQYIDKTIDYRIQSVIANKMFSTLES